MEVRILCDVEEGLPPLVPRQLHPVLRLRLEKHHFIGDPLLLVFCKHKVGASEVLLPVVGRDDDSHEEVHQEKVAYDYHQNEEEGPTWLGDCLIGCLIESPELCCSVHDLTPLHCVRDDKQARHRLNGVIEVHELVVPNATVIQAFPLSLRSASNACLSTVVELASEIVDRYYAEDKVEKERDYHDRYNARDCNA